MSFDKSLQQGIDALKAGRRDEARSRLMRVIEQDERNEMAWLWLSGAVDTEEQRYTCLKNVLAVNPYNGTAKRGIESLRKRSPGLTPVPIPQTPEDKAKPQPAETLTSGAGSRPATNDELNEILHQAIEAIKAGDGATGKQLLIEVIKQNETNETAWLWLTRCVAERDLKRECFERVLEINPQNEHAIKGLKRLEGASKVTSSTPSQSSKMVKVLSRLIIGTAAALLVIMVALIGIWWVMG